MMKNFFAHDKIGVLSPLVSRPENGMNIHRKWDDFWSNGAWGEMASGVERASLARPW